jgi:hypothetical protein
MQIGGLVTELGLNQCAYGMVKSFNELAAGNEHQVTAYWQRLANPASEPCFATMNLSELNTFKGIGIATTLELADTLLKNNSAVIPFYYIFDIEWLKTIVSFDYAMNIMRDPHLSLIARSKSHQAIIENYCNKPVAGIVEDWNLDQLLPLLQESIC